MFRGMSEHRIQRLKAIIERLGGFTAVATASERTLTSVYRWTYEETRGGTGGVVPSDAIEKLLGHAAKQGIALEAGEFFSSSGHEGDGGAAAAEAAA